MKAPLLVAAVMFFTTAVATNGGVPSKKDGVAPNKKGGARSRDQKFPPSCTRFNTEYQYDPATQLHRILDGVQTVASCANSCHHNTHCQYWTIFHPTDPKDNETPTLRQPGDCVLLKIGTGPEPPMITGRNGFFSGSQNCQ